MTALANQLGLTKDSVGEGGRGGGRLKTNASCWWPALFNFVKVCFSICDFLLLLALGNKVESVNCIQQESTSAQTDIFLTMAQRKMAAF